MLRITNAPKPTSFDVTPQLRYALVFRLNRNPYKLNNPPFFRASGGVRNNPTGQFSVLGHYLGNEEGPALIKDNTYCFALFYTHAYRGDPGNLDPPNLDNILPGAPVEITMRFRTPKGRHHRWKLGPLHKAAPPMLVTDYHLSSHARQALRRFGCDTGDVLLRY